MLPLKAEPPRKAQRQQRQKAAKARKPQKAQKTRKRFRLKKQPPAGYMTTAQAAEYLGVSVKTIRRYIQLHGLPAEKPGGVYLIERAALDLWARMNG